LRDSHEARHFFAISEVGAPHVVAFRLRPDSDNLLVLTSPPELAPHEHPASWSSSISTPMLTCYRASLDIQAAGLGLNAKAYSFTQGSLKIHPSFADNRYRGCYPMIENKHGLKPAAIK
jgi:hypothetical protein